MASAIAFSCLGWAFDLFDLFILLYVAPTLGKVFFDSSRQMSSLVGVYAAFAATLLMRPVGGYLFGRYADRNGRKRAMAMAAIGVGVATALMGTIPTIETIGIAAPMIFIALRLIQGVFMGGMVASTHTVGTESIAAKWRGLASGIISGGGSGLGKLLASLVFLLVTWIFPGHAFQVWGWRFMFFSGLLSALLGLLVFTELEESPMWSELQKGKIGAAAVQKPALPSLIQGGFLGAVIISIFLTMAGGGLSYLTSGYLPTFMRLINHVPPKKLGVILSLSAISVIVFSVFAGYITDIIGRKTGVILYGLLSLIAIPTLYLRLAHATAVIDIGVLSILLSGAGAMCYAPLLIILNERFPTELRSSGTAISWNIGFALGGSMPIVVSFVSKVASDPPLSLAVSTATLSAMYLLAVHFTPETRGHMHY
ncbi:MAG: MFS transporter [Proteobacteria bacterium]|nr:MFS transporter [Pseudomonadota bacterium]